MNPRDAQTRAENVGSFLRTPEALRAASSRAPGPEAAAVLDAAVLDVLKLQREAGVDVVTDGELRRSNWADTPDFLDCFDKVPGNTGGLRHQFHHAIDLAPTMLDLAGVAAPTMYRGVEQLPVRALRRDTVAVDQAQRRRRAQAAKVH